MIGYYDTPALIKLFVDEKSRARLRCTGWATRPLGHRHEYYYPGSTFGSRASHNALIMSPYNCSSHSRAEINTGVVRLECSWTLP